MAALLKEWRKNPAAELAESLEAELAALDAAPVPADQKAWLNAAKAPTPETLAALLASLKAARLEDTVDRFRALAPRLPDPRIAAAFVAFVRAVPFTSDTSKSAWQGILPLLVRAGDPRAIGQLREIRDNLKVRPLFQTWFSRRLDDVIAELAEAFPDGVPTVDAKRGAELAAKKPAKKAPSAAAKTSSSLLDAVFANPTDDGARLVLADALQETGDVRGEFISLQCAQKDEKRQKALIKQHSKQWVGALEPWVGSEVKFRRGFVNEATLKLKNEAEALAAERVPAWSTLEVVRIAKPPGGASANEKWTQWLPATLRDVQELHDLSSDGVARVLDIGKAWRPRLIGFHGGIIPAGPKALLASPVAEAVVDVVNLPMSVVDSLPKQVRRVVTLDNLSPAMLKAVVARPTLRLERAARGRFSETATFMASDGGVALALELEEFGERHPGLDFLGAAKQAEGTMTRVKARVEKLVEFFSDDDVASLVITLKKPRAAYLDAAAEAAGLAALLKAATARSKKLKRYDLTAIGGDAKS